MSDEMNGAVSPETEMNADSGDSSSEEMMDQASGEELLAEGTEEETPEQQLQELKKKLKLKVDGQELEEEIDWNDEEKLTRYIQKAKAFDKRAQEFASFKNQVESLFSQLQNSPETVLEKMGIDLDQFAEQRIQKRIEEMSKTPEQIAREQMEKELNDLREEKKRLENERQTAEMEALKNKMAAEIESDIMSALDDAKTVLPKRNPEVLKRVASTMMLAIKNGFPEVTAKDVIPIVEKQWKEEVQSLFNVLPEDILEGLLGKQNLERMRKQRLSAKKSVNTATAKQLVRESGIKTQKEDTKNKRKQSYRDFFKS